MLKRIMSVAAGVLAWMAITALAGLVIRASWPQYAAAVPTRSYSLLMLWGRLSTGALALLAASRLTAAIARTPSPAVFVGLVLLAISLPWHVRIWPEYPVWYHLVYLSYLVPLSALGGRMGQRMPHAAAHEIASHR